MNGARGVKLLLLAPVPAPVVTRIFPGPYTFGGTCAVICVGEFTTYDSEFESVNDTPVTPAKFVPVITTL